MQPKCPKCEGEIDTTKFVAVLACKKCNWVETTIKGLMIKTKNQEVYWIATAILDYLQSQAVRKVIESERLTKIEERIAYLERQGDERNDNEV